MRSAGKLRPKLVFSETLIRDVWIGRSEISQDTRGTFQEWFSVRSLPDSISFIPMQANVSTSKKGVIRGIHFSIAPAGQRKLVTCLSGAIRDIFVDLRSDSQTYLQWGFEDLTPESGKSVYLGQGIGHGFQALKESSTVAYLLDSEYRPEMEFGITPFDEQLNISWPLGEFELSEKDKMAPSIHELISIGKLP